MALVEHYPIEALSGTQKTDYFGDIFDINALIRIYLNETIVIRTQPPAAQKSLTILVIFFDINALFRIYTNE